MTRRLLHTIRGQRGPNARGEPRAEAARAGGVAARWRCLTLDPATGRRFTSTPLLDGLALAMDDVLAGVALDEGWMLRGPVLADPAGDCRAAAAATAAAMRRGIASGVADDRETALLLWLVKYADVGVPEPMRTIHPSRLERRRARSRLGACCPTSGEIPAIQRMRGSWIFCAMRGRRAGAGSGTSAAAASNGIPSAMPAPYRHLLFRSPETVDSRG